MLRRFFSKTGDIHKNYIFRQIVIRSFTVGWGVVNNYNEKEWYRIHSSYREHPYQNNGYGISYRLYSKRLIIGNASECLDKSVDKEQNTIKQLFPNPRVTLNELSAKMPNKVFDILYKQHTFAPKGSTKTKVNQVNDWTCSYMFTWPKSIKFETTGRSKKQAAEKSALLALDWLYKFNHIDKTGSPILGDNYKSVENLNEPLVATITENTAERIRRIWDDYQNGMKEIFDKYHEETIKRTHESPLFLSQDSTIDTEDPILTEDLENSNANNVSEFKLHIHPVYGKPIPKPSTHVLERRNRTLKRKFAKYEKNIPPLPMDNYVNLIAETLENTNVAILVGAAGCGKSTRTPTAVLKYFGANTRVIVSEPRRVAAIGLAETVASDMGEGVGETVGYQVRFNSKLPCPPTGSILFCTSGVLLRRLQSNPGLDGCTHVIIDEAHERDVNTDISLLLLKRALKLNPELKVIIMSATLDIDVFCKYFDSCPIIEVPGRQFPVSVTYLEDLESNFNIDLSQTKYSCSRQDGKGSVHCDEVVQLIKAIDKKVNDGAILVFLTGWSDINYCYNLLDKEFAGRGNHLILPVHSKLSPEDQKKIFSHTLPGVRKIVLATNIAETSITVRDVVHVIDTGLRKENRTRESTGVSSLETEWISKAAAKQRMGRAGRVQPGHCYKLYTKDKEAEFPEYTTPEILRIPLESIVLDCKIYAPKEKAKKFLIQLPEPPNEGAIEYAVNELIDLGALTENEDLTSLGSKLSLFTLHPRLACSVLNSAVLCNIVSTANICSIMSEGPKMFQSNRERENIREIKRKYSLTSDHSALHRIQDDFEQILQTGDNDRLAKFIENNELQKKHLFTVRALSNLYLEQLLEFENYTNKSQIQQLNRFSEIEEINLAALLTGCNSLLVTRRQLKTKGKLIVVNKVYTSTGEKAHIHTESVNSNITKESSSDTRLLLYFGGLHSSDRRALIVDMSSVITPIMAVLCCRGPVEVHYQKWDDVEMSVLSLPKHKLNILVPNSQAQDILRAREMLWKTLNFYHERDARYIDEDTDNKVFIYKMRLVKALGRMLLKSDKNFVGEQEDDIQIDNKE